MLISKDVIMIIQAFLFALNVMLGMLNYGVQNYEVAMFNMAIAGLCLAFLIDLIMEKS